MSRRLSAFNLHLAAQTLYLACDSAINSTGSLSTISSWSSNSDSGASSPVSPVDSLEDGCAATTAGAEIMLDDYCEKDVDHDDGTEEPYLEDYFTADDFCDPDDVVFGISPNHKSGSIDEVHAINLPDKQDAEMAFGPLQEEAEEWASRWRASVRIVDQEGRNQEKSDSHVSTGSSAMKGSSLAYVSVHLPPPDDDDEEEDDDEEQMAAECTAAVGDKKQDNGVGYSTVLKLIKRMSRRHSMSL